MEQEEEMKKKGELYRQRLDEVLNEYYLNNFQKAMVTNFIEQKVGDRENKNVQFVRNWLFNKINRTMKVVGIANKEDLNWYQKGCPEIIEGLTSRPWWDNREFEWIQQIQQHSEVIRQELLSLRNHKGFQPYRGPSWTSNLKAEDGVGSKSHDTGDWNVFYLFLHDLKFDQNCQLVPKTVQIIEKYLPRHYKHAFFSAMNPYTHIINHCGPTNKKLRFHLPLLGVEGSQLRVANETRTLHTDQPYLFDDSFDHEAWHNGNSTRIILIADIWHPDLSDEEVKFFTLLQNSKMRYEKKITEQLNDEDNFYKIIEKSKIILKNNDWWVYNEQKNIN